MPLFQWKTSLFWSSGVLRALFQTLYRPIISQETQESNKLHVSLTALFL